MSKVIMNLSTSFINYERNTFKKLLFRGYLNNDVYV